MSVQYGFACLAWWTSSVALVALALACAGSFTAAQETSSVDTSPSNSKPKAPTEEQAENAAWEYRPYRVAVWLCGDGAPAIDSNLEPIELDLVRQSELIDPSGWVLTVTQPPSQWRWVFMASLEHPEAYTEAIPEIESLSGFDKLMIVKLDTFEGQYICQVRELDIRTQQWGAIIDGSATRVEELAATVMESISRAFMPVARVDRVSENDEVFLRVRATQACLRAEMAEDGSWQVNPITDSPVWIDPSDRFLPVIRRTDRQGNLVRLEPIDYTFLTIEEQDGPKVKCSIQSYHRAPLAGRKSKRSQKLALVIRPPDRSTILQLVARGEKQTPLEGYEVWSGHPGAKKGEFELLGPTDWKGEIEITPSERGMRILYIKHGNRALKKLPIIPGLYPRLVSTVPDDETRLYAEGIISGLQNEILNLVAQRQVYEAEIAIALKNKEIKEARELLVKYQDLPTPQDLGNSLSNEESRLRSRAVDRRELEFITTMFNTLREILSSKIVDSKESELRRRLQEASAPGASKQTVNETN